MEAATGGILADVRKIAVVRANGLGDFLFALPALESLDGKTQLAIRDLARVGNDIRILARPLA